MEGHNDRASFPVDYDAYAPTYAWARRAVPWVLQPLVRLAGVLPAKASVLEIGCGTGNYISALSDTRGDLAYCAFDLSEAMLSEARSRGSSVVFLRGDASEVFPFPDQTFAFAFAVDVIHHIDDLSRFFAEAHRVLAPVGRLAVVTDSESTLKRRSLTCFFPEILPIELARYPSVSLLHKQANRAGLQLFSEEEVMGKIALDGEFLARLEAKCSSAMRLMDPEAHAAGMERVRAAGKRGQQWFSYYDVLLYARSTMKDAEISLRVLSGASGRRKDSFTRTIPAASIGRETDMRMIDTCRAPALSLPISNFQGA